MQHIDQSLLETLYRHRSTLETIFRIVDTDNSGRINVSAVKWMDGRIDFQVWSRF